MTNDLDFPPDMPPAMRWWLVFLRATLGSENLLISWATTIVGTALLLAPIAFSFRWAARRWPKHVLAVCGVIGGLSFPPISLWFYLHFGTDCLRMTLMGMPGVYLFVAALSPVLLIDLQEDVSFGVGMIFMFVFWSGSFGLLGCIADLILARFGIDVEAILRQAAAPRS